MEEHLGMRTASTSMATATASSSSPACTNSSDKPGHITDRQFEIEFLDPGAAALCFTFG
jgi:hypothetical protein